MTPRDAGPHAGPAPWLLVLAVALGGAVGALARWAAVDLTPPETGFPATTFTINLSGSFVLALLPGLLARRRPRARALATAALGPGLLGGWTTLSAYAEQSRALVADGRVLLAAAYLVGTLAACLVACRVGSALTGRLGEGDAS